MFYLQPSRFFFFLIKFPFITEPRIGFYPSDVKVQEASRDVAAARLRVGAAVASPRPSKDGPGEEAEARFFACFWIIFHMFLECFDVF